MGRGHRSASPAGHRPLRPRVPAGLPPASQPYGWTGLRPMTPDGLPVIGPLPGKENVLVASGHGMLGVTLAPVTADIISANVRGGGQGTDTAGTARPFSPQRFAARRGRAAKR
ncbi:FAD-dependent oxidoreductase [Streptomyces sp. E11-3]|uniref:NAD(P)/FAD-dependent oxidoreductase n=1 Tax=Streptomyces sp. E11-3 TaxID=3110112 RepID=UPI00397EA440